MICSDYTSSCKFSFSESQLIYLSFCFVSSGADADKK